MKVEDYLPLTETSLFILLSLAITPKHGYGIIKEVEALSAGRVVLAAGTLYSALRRMLEDGWIERLAGNDSQGTGRERKLYRLTDLGRRMFECLLHLYPPHFRGEFSAEIRAIFWDRLHEAKEQGRWVAGWTLLTTAAIPAALIAMAPLAVLFT